MFLVWEEGYAGNARHIDVKYVFERGDMLFPIPFLCMRRTMAEHHRIGKIHAGAWPTCGNKQHMPRAVAQRGDQCFELHAWYGVTALGEQDAPMRELVVSTKSGQILG